eukprot:4504435-Prymnesium_polylepis.1
MAVRARESRCSLLSTTTRAPPSAAPCAQHAVDSQAAAAALGHRGRALARRGRRGRSSRRDACRVGHAACLARRHARAARAHRARRRGGRPLLSRRLVPAAREPAAALAPLGDL